MGGGYVLEGGEGTGAVAVEAALTLIGAPYRLVEAPAADTLAGVAPANAMRQVPALTFPSSLPGGGETLTESAAILLRLSELHPDAGLAPGLDDPRRGPFLRWMSFVSSAIYAHYWLKDDPSRLVPDPAQHAAVEANLNARIGHCWGIMERGLTAPDPYILGAELTVLDLYVTVVSRFRPRRRCFYEVAPRMGEAVRRVDADPRLAGLWARRYPFFEGWEEMPA